MYKIYFNIKKEILNVGDIITISSLDDIFMPEKNEYYNYLACVKDISNGIRLEHISNIIIENKPIMENNIVTFLSTIRVSLHAVSPFVMRGEYIINRIDKRYLYQHLSAKIYDYKYEHDAINFRENRFKNYFSDIFKIMDREQKLKNILYD